MKRKYRKMKKEKKKGKQYLVEYLAFTECSRVGCLLFSPMLARGLFIIMLLQTQVPVK